MIRSMDVVRLCVHAELLHVEISSGASHVTSGDELIEIIIPNLGHVEFRTGWTYTIVDRRQSIKHIFGS
jgi:hypothetical protein